ncbi:MFS transporter [Acidovorax sp. SRB_24]|uniref:MFS transporter n=1 Tax=Acidovorax sp. SRB_24 TaxID=1962700 RepID=UPI00145E92AC|nr:MFS transporter [Acidovorax sp. SRB_24]NMM75494.1 MFS transporter [Acidovorax sp. SRB_24]
MSTTPLPRPRPGLARLLPAGVDPGAWPLLAARGLRAFGDGYMAVLLPAYLLSIGLGTLEVGIVSTATMLGSALATLAVGAWGYRFAGARLLRCAALLMAATGLGFAGLSSFWPLLVVALVGTLNPSSGDVSVFLPLEHARLAAAAQGHARTALFARYSLVGALCAALGALAAAVPDWLVRHGGLARLDALRGMFAVYAAIGLAVFWLYRNLPAHAQGGNADSMPVAAPLGPSRGVVVRLAALFSVDAFAGGLTVNALMSLWLLERFGFSLTQAGVFFFWTGLLGAASQLAASVVAQRIGLLNTMVFTHLPANACLVLAALAPSLPVALGLLMVRSALSSMDVPTRTAYVMAVVTPAERSAAASFTAVPRSLAAAISPTLSGALFAAGWISLPLIACGLLKITYDLALWRAMRRNRLDGQ